MSSPATQWPDPAVLELLVTTGQLGSLSRASRELGWAQPNASRAIARLERRLGLHLLDRDHTGSRLTSAGHELAADAQPLLAAARTWRQHAELLARTTVQSLEVAASQTVADHLAPAWLTDFHRHHPGQQVRLQVTNSARVLELVARSEVALGFTETPTTPEGIAWQVVAVDRLCVVVPVGHRWTRRRRPLDMTELAATPLVVREQGSGTRETLDAVLAGHEASAPALELASNAAVLGACIAGGGPAVLSELAVEQALDGSRVRRIPLAQPDLLRRELRAVWLPPRPAPQARELLDLILASLGSTTTY